MKSGILWILLFPSLARTNPADRQKISSLRKQKSLGGNIKFFLDNLSGRKSTGRDSTGDDIAELGDAIVDCLFDPVECVVVPIAEDPTDPYLLSALGMAVFSGGLAANSLISPASQRNNYFPILLDDAEETDQVFDDEGVSIIITKTQDKSPISFLVGGSEQKPHGGKHKQHGSKHKQGGGKHKQTGNRNKKSKQPDNGHRRPSGGKKRPQDKKKRPGSDGGANSPQHGGGQNGEHSGEYGEEQRPHIFIQKLQGGGQKPHSGGQNIHDGGEKLHGGGNKPHGGGQKTHSGGQKHKYGGKKPHRGGHKQSRKENNKQSNENHMSPRIESQGETSYQPLGSGAFSARSGNSASSSINDLPSVHGLTPTTRSRLPGEITPSESVSYITKPQNPDMQKTEIRQNTEITSQIPRGKDKSSEKILEIERHSDIPLLEDFPGCGLLGSQNSSHHPWLGALYAVDIQGTKADKLISSVALLSITTRNHSRLPTIVVAPGSIIEPYILSMTDTGVSVSGDNIVTAAELEIMGLRAEVRFGDLDKQVILAVLSIVQHPHFAGTECLVEPCGPPSHNNKNDVSILHLDTAPLWDLAETENVFPACLPKEDGVHLTSVGWRLEDSQQTLPVMSSGVLDRYSSVQQTRISVSDQRKLTSCQTVSNKSLVTEAANGTLCITGDKNDRPTVGHLLIGETSNHNTVSVLGFLQDPQTTSNRLRHEYASRLSCFLGWIADQYNLRWESTTTTSSVETGTSCPDLRDSPLGSLGIHVKHHPGAVVLNPNYRNISML